MRLAQQTGRYLPSGLDAYRHQLIACWPRRWPGVHHVELCDGQLHLQLHYGQAEDILPTLDFTADAWFLDGFAPARNDLRGLRQFCAILAD